jgi:hypothetical protein
MFKFAVCTLLMMIVVWALVGCACPPQSYQTVPTWLVPAKPTVPTVMAADLMCLSDDAYTRLAERDQACWQHVRELRAVLGVAQ